MLLGQLLFEPDVRDAPSPSEMTSPVAMASNAPSFRACYRVGYDQ